MDGQSTSRSLSIAQFAPLIEPVPPVFYGGIERMVYHLTEDLTRLGHKVTLFASGDSRTSAELVPCCEKAVRLNPSVFDSEMSMLSIIRGMRHRLETFDLLHFHTDLIKHPVFRNISARAVTTVHMPPECPIYGPRFETCPNTPVVAISQNQRSTAPDLNWVGTVYHGFPNNLFEFVPAPRGDYLAFLSRLEPDKRPDRAIEIAKQSGMRLKIAGKIGDMDRDYFDRCVKPLLLGNGVEFLGEIDEADKGAFLGNAKALLFPIEWREAFGLVMIESMACGTPVIAFSRGSVPEIVEEGVTGFIVNSVEQAADAVHRVGSLDRATIRRRFEERFGLPQMTSGYLKIYESLLKDPVDYL